MTLGRVACKGYVVVEVGREDGEAAQGVHKGCCYSPEPG